MACSYTLKPKFIINKLYNYLPNYKLNSVVISNNHIVKQITIKKFHIKNKTNSLFKFSAYKKKINFLKNSSLLPSKVPILILNNTLFLKHNAKFFLKKIVSYYSTIQKTKLPTIASRLNPYNNICYSNS